VTVPGVAEEITMLARFADRTRRKRRPGATIVESALVLSVFLMLLFGMFEYCRFLMVLHITNNAARDGARYAAVRVNTPADEILTTRQAIVDYTTMRMGGVQKNIEGFRVGVYSVDQAGLNLSPPVIRPKSINTTAFPDPFNPADPLALPWNSAPFPERLAVTIDGTYRPLLPTFLMMPTTIPINVTSMVSGEG
jgi:Flp pilus assembly protein TadG